jgi:hypothetical protein
VGAPGVVNSLFGLIIIYSALFSPFATYLLRSFLVSIPMDFEEAARIDGANDIQVLTRIILPLAWPGFLTVVLVVGLGVWNEFLFAVTFLQRPELKPISTSLQSFQGRFQRDWGLTSAASVIMIIPIIILFLSLQRQFIEGLSRGGSERLNNDQLTIDNCQLIILHRKYPRKVHYVTSKRLHRARLCRRARQNHRRLSGPPLRRLDLRQDHGTAGGDHLLRPRAASGAADRHRRRHFGHLHLSARLPDYGNRRD